MANPDAAATDGRYLATRGRTIFIDTSLDTHMVMVVGEADTVAYLKKKIKEEHHLCFPEAGKISINALQVKRRGLLYHLSDSMYVKNAFDGVKSKWFLYVDASRMVKHGLDIRGPFPRADGILRCLEHKDLVDVSDEILNEPKKILQDFPEDNLLNGKDIGNVTGDMVRKVLSDLEMELEQTGDEHRRTSSSDTNKRVKPKAYESTFPDSEMKTSRRKRKADDTENQVDKDMPIDDVMDEHDKMSKSERKKRKIQKKEKTLSNRRKTKNNSSALVAPGGSAQEEIVPINFTNNSAVDMLCHSVLEGRETLNSVPSTVARQETGNEARYDVPKKNQNHLYRLNIVPANEQSNGAEAMQLEPVAEAVSPDLPHKSVSEDSLMPEIPKVGKQKGGSDFNAAQSSDVSLEKGELGNKKMKKKKSKSKYLQNQLPPTALIPAEDKKNDKIKDTKDSQFADAVEQPTANYLGVKNVEDALQDPRKFSPYQTYPVEQNELLDKHTEKMWLENQKPDDQGESKLVEEDHGVMPNFGDTTHSKSSKKSRKTKKGGSVEAAVSDGFTNDISPDKSQKVVPITNDGSLPDPSSEMFLADISRHGVHEGSFGKLDVPMNGKSVGDLEFRRTDALDENSNPITKRKKNKTMASNQPLSTISLLEKHSDGDIVNDTVIQSAGVCKESDPKHLAVNEMEDVMQDNQGSATDQTTLVEGQGMEPKSTDKVPSESQKPADSNENRIVVEVSELFHRDVAMAQLKSGKKVKKERNGSESGRKKKTKTVTMSEETTKEEVLLNQNVENTVSNLEKTSIPHFRSNREETYPAEKATERSDFDDLRGTKGLNMPVIPVREASSEAAQPKTGRNLECQVPTVEKDNKKSKMKSSTDHSNNRDKSVEADDGDLANFKFADGLNQSAPSSGTITGGADVPQVEGKPLGLIAGTSTSAADNATGKKLSSTTDDAVASGDAVVVKEEWMTAKGKLDEAKMKRKSKNIQDGNKFQVESSQDSLSMHQPHGGVLHSDTESFRVPKSTAPQSSGTSSKQKFKSSHKRSKLCGSNDIEIAASHSPSASDARKPKLSRKEANLNNNDSKAVSHQQLIKDAETLSESNSAFKSPTNRRPKKSKQSSTKKSSTAETKETKSGATRRKTLLSTNIFKDDNDESSDDDHGVYSGPSAATALDYFSASEVSEMEDNEGFTTPQTVGQRRRAAEANSDSRVNEYTLEDLRNATLLEKAKRGVQMSQDSDTQLDEFVPDSQADRNP